MRTLDEATWRDARVARDVGAEMRALEHAGGRDIARAQQPSIIQALVAADLLDELRLNVLPSIAGGGLRLLHDGLPPSRWQLVGAHVRDGAVGLYMRRAR